MRTYETMFILRPDLEEEKLNSLVERFKNLIADRGGEVLKTNLWGKRNLAYEIRKFREGYYVIMQFKGDGEITKELERVYRITDEVLRFIIITLEEKKEEKEESSPIEEAVEEVKEEAEEVREV